MEKLTRLMALMSFHQEDLASTIHDLELLHMIQVMAEARFPARVRQNSCLSICLLTYNKTLFGLMVGQGFLELLLQISQEPEADLKTKEFSTLALVHFAL